MSVIEPSFTIGIEEEYLLVDLETRDLATAPPESLLKECETALEGQVSPEFLRSQIEIGTRVCNSMPQAREELARLRRTVAQIARKYGLAPIACSTHPFAEWSTQHHTDKARYKELAQNLQVVGRRLVICGMHVHAGIENDDLRMDLLNQLRYFLPHLLALSTSSPFWQSENTGLKSYRIPIFDEMPRTGMPPRFNSFSEYERTVQVLVKAGVIEDGTKIWWDARPSSRFPTIEMRICDVCTFLDDAICIAAFYVCILRMLYRLRRTNQRWRTYPTFLLDENRWRAQRHGTEKGLIDFGRGEVVPFKDLIDELLDLILEDAEELNCVNEVRHAHTIIERGTSADRQIERFHMMKETGSTDKEALIAVVDMLIAETLEGTD